MKLVKFGGKRQNQGFKFGGMVTLIENLGNLHILGKAFDIDKGIIPAHSTLHNLDNGIIKG